MTVGQRQRKTPVQYITALLLYCLLIYIFQQKTDDGNNSVVLVVVPVVPQFLYSDLISDPNHFSCWLSGSEKFCPLFYLYLGKTQARRHTTWRLARLTCLAQF